jgi:hypothetical protein
LYAAALDPGNLRQGDILRNVPFPLLLHAKTLLLGSLAAPAEVAPLPSIVARSHEHRGDPAWVTVQVPARYGYCAVISNCCDLEVRDGAIPAHAVVLARLRPISPDLRNDAARLESLRANKDPRDPDDPGYIDYFYVEPDVLLHNEDWIVHYHQLISIPMADRAILLQKKILQLDDRTRMKFKIKLAFAFGRANEDEIAAGLENPWAPPAAPAQPPVPSPPL